MLWLQVLITIVVTSVIVWAATWIKRNREKHPELHKNRNLIGMIVYFVLNFGDF